MRNIFLMNVFLCSFLASQSAMAFIFEQSEATAYLNASDIPNTLGNITSSASGSATVQADGSPTHENLDTIKIESVWFNPEFANRGFNLQIQVASQGWRTIDQSIGNCVWINEGCSSNWPGSVENYPTLPVAVRLVRNTTSPYNVIPNGTGIATINLRQYSRTQPWGGWTAKLHYLLNGSVTPIVPTCNVGNFDKTVPLPEVGTYEISKYKWRYQAVNKEFTINIACENISSLGITFNGDKLEGSDHALKNLNSGNPNIGIQIMYGDTPLAIGEELKIFNSSVSSAALKFKAYYYNKGGEVNSGDIRAQSEFVFNYQ